MALTSTKPPGSTHLGGRPIIAARSPDPRLVVFESDDHGALLARLVNVTPTGGGGVETIDRPYNRPLTEWTGSTPEGLSIEMFFDGFPDVSVEPAVRTLEIMAGAFTGGAEPDELTISGRAIPHGVEAASQNRWQISQELEWGDVERNRAGVRVRQYVTVTLLLVSESDALDQIKPAATAPTYKIAIAKAGDTFEKIANRELGTKRLAQKLRRLNVDLGVAYFNGWRSVDRRIREGTPVRLPTAKTLKDWKRGL